MITAIDTTNWVRVPFSTNGYDFNSVLDPMGSIYRQVQRVGNEIFISMNKACITELWAERSHLTIDELLAVINDGGTQAFVELAGN